MKFFHTFESFNLNESFDFLDKRSEIYRDIEERLNEHGIEITDTIKGNSATKNRPAYILANGLYLVLDTHYESMTEYVADLQLVSNTDTICDWTNDVAEIVKAYKAYQKANEAYDPKSSLRKDLQTVLDWCKANDVHVVRQNLNDHNFTVFFDHDLTITVTDISHGKIMLSSMPFYFNSIEEGLNMLHQLVPSIQLRQIEELANEMGLEMTSYNIATVHRWFYFANGSALNLALKISHGLHWQISAWIRPRPNAHNINAGIQTDLRSAFKLLAKSNNIKESVDPNHERRAAYLHELESQINALGLEIKAAVHEGGELYTIHLPHGFQIDVIAYTVGGNPNSFRLSDKHKSTWHHWTPKLADVVKAYQKLEFLS